MKCYYFVSDTRRG